MHSLYSKSFCFFLFVFFSFSTATLFAQPGAGQAAGIGRPAVMGKLYGKVVDQKNDAIPYASVQLWGMVMDTITKKPTKKIISGQLSAENGDFVLEEVPVAQEAYTLIISSIGYEKYEQPVQLMRSGTAKLAEKDLGNIKLQVSDAVLKTVTVTDDAPQITLALDKTIYRLDKNILVQGGTGEDALRNIPGLSVDIDGNVQMRNSAPQIFIDGRPTTLTPDQLPADAIDRIEVIANPSAKFDASGGQGGIINIVLKKERRIGYNGQIRTGIDTNLGYQLGGDLNVREGKWNVFFNGNSSVRQTYSTGETKRNNLVAPKNDFLQRNVGDNRGQHNNYKMGIDWFLDNRNTLTVSGNYTNGRFNPLDSNISEITTYYIDSTVNSGQIRFSDFTRKFDNKGASLLYKHLFPQEGHELTADINYNEIVSLGNGDYRTRFTPNQFLGLEQQTQRNENQFYTIQTDYAKPLKHEDKLELGARLAVRNFKSDMAYFQFQGDDYVRIPNFADQYEFNDQVYALYGNYNRQFQHWGLQAGLRAESSSYTGTLPQIDTAYTINYPISLFPSLFFSRKLNTTDNVQIAMTRRINRPTFFQLIPFTDFGDSLNIQRGNPDLRPEFTNSIELSYFNIIKPLQTLMLTTYFKQTSDLMIRYLFDEYNTTLSQNVVVASYANAGRAYLYGGEATLRNTFFKTLEVTTNLNAYQSSISAENVVAGLNINLFSWFLKENINWRLPKGFSFQVSGEYFSRTALVSNSNSGGGGSRGGGGGGGGGGWMQGPTSSAQGYTIPYWFVDLGVRKDFFNRKLSVSANWQDIFRTRIQGSYTDTDTFIQDTWRLRNPQIFRLNLSYKFGKQDASIFRRKNTNGGEGQDMM